MSDVFTQLAKTTEQWYEFTNAKAKSLFEKEFDHYPVAQRPRWESQPLGERVLWLNRAARVLAVVKTGAPKP